MSPSYQEREEWARRRLTLKRFHEFDGKHARLFGKILRAKPVVGTDGFVSLVEKAADFFGEVFLSGVELFAIGLVQVLFGCRDA